MMNFQHVALPSRSFENSDRFFQEILGLKKVKTSVLDPELALTLFGRAERWDMVLYRGGTLAVEVFVSESAPAVSPPVVHVCLDVDNREAFLTRCHAAGLEVIRAPRGDAVVVFIRDFDGNRYEIKEKP